VKFLFIMLLFVFALPLYAQNGSKELWSNAHDLMQQQRYSDAILELKKLPQSPEKLYWMAYSASMIAELQSAEQYARDAVALEGNWADSRILLGDILHLRNKPEEALAEYNRALRLQPANIQVLLKAAQLEMQMQRFQNSQSRFKEVLALDPNNVNAKLGLAQLRTYQKRYDDAMREYNTIIKYSKDEEVLTSAKIGLARVYAWTKRFSEAEKVLSEVLVWKPQTVQALELLAQVYEWSGTYTKAKRTYESILTWRPDHKEAKAKLVELQWVR